MLKESLLFSAGPSAGYHASEAVELADPPTGSGSRSFNQHRSHQIMDSRDELGFSNLEELEVEGHPSPETAQADGDLAELELLREENTELRQRLAVSEKQLTELSQRGRAWANQQRDYEAMLDEKSDVIRELHAKIQELQGRPTAPAPATPHEEEVLALSEQLEEERRQLKEDEEALHQQMKNLELQMSRERAEMARQRVELQRLHDELKMELEMAARESTLRDRLMPLQRKHSDIRRRADGQTAPKPSTPQNGQPAEAPEPTPRTNTSGIFRRLFGSQE